MSFMIIGEWDTYSLWVPMTLYPGAEPPADELAGSDEVKDVGAFEE